MHYHGLIDVRNNLLGYMRHDEIRLESARLSLIPINKVHRYRVQPGCPRCSCKYIHVKLPIRCLSPYQTNDVHGKQQLETFYQVT